MKDSLAHLKTFKANKKIISLLLLTLILLIIIPFIGFNRIHFNLIWKKGLDSFIFWKLRFPRVTMGLFAGGIYALLGLISQNLFKNNLASPDVLGVSAGAAAGSIVAIKVGLTAKFLGLSGVVFLGILGGMVSILVITFAIRILKNQSIFALLMIGIAINLFFSAFIILMQYLFDFSNTLSILRWLMGGLIVNSYQEVSILAAVTFLLFLFFFIFHKEILLLSASEEFCLAKGLNISRFRFFVMIVLSLFVSILVSLTGPIGFISLVVPHIARFLGKNRFIGTVSFTFFLGAIVLMVSDLLARALAYPVEIPVGVITSFLGAPIFLIILVQNLKKND